MTMGQRQSSQANDDAAHRQLLGEHEELSAQHQLLAEEHRKQGQLLLDVQQDYIKTREGARTILSVLDATIDGLEKSVA